MMAGKRQQGAGPLDVTVGFAADDRGNGIAYAKTGRRGAPAAVRVPFTVRRHRALAGREIAYAALSAVAERILKSYDGAIRFAVDDDVLAADLDQRRSVPPALTMPYVVLRCRLNRFSDAYIVHAAAGATGDLVARARAEVSLNIAA